MSESWPATEISDILKHSADTVRIEPDRDYHEITVKLWGKGVVLRGTVSGARISGSRRFVAKSGQFILSRIDARNGAFGIVPNDLDGAIVTNDFPLFDLEKTLIDPDYLSWLSKTHAFIELCTSASEGTTNRVRLQEERFLSSKIHLPPLAEQRRIVARIEELAVRIVTASSSRDQAVQAAEALRRTVAEQAFVGDCPRVRLEEVCALITDGTHQTPRYVEDGFTFLSAQNIKPFRFMPELHRHISLEDYEACVAHVKPQRGDVLMTRVGAGIGEAAVIDQDIDFAFYVSLALIRPMSDKLSSRFLVHWLNSPRGLMQSRRQTLGRGHSQGNLNLILLRGFDVPQPPLSDQLRLVSFLDRLNAKWDSMRKLHVETGDLLQVLRPSVLDEAFKGCL
jgi:type I restriction enzyme S subunit